MKDMNTCDSSILRTILLVMMDSNYPQTAHSSAKLILNLRNPNHAIVKGTVCNILLANRACKCCKSFKILRGGAETHVTSLNMSSNTLNLPAVELLTGQSKQSEQQKELNGTSDFQSRLLSAYDFKDETEIRIQTGRRKFEPPSFGQAPSRKRKKGRPGQRGLHGFDEEGEWATLCQPIREEWISLMNRTVHPPDRPATSATPPRDARSASRGNYSSYYWRRLGGAGEGAMVRCIAPGVWDDARLGLMRAEWFAGRRCLDVGCNAGLLTMSIAYKFRSPLCPPPSIDPDRCAVRNSCQAKTALRAG